jgi:DtxR family Mn-dependent transcriptional regulator
MLILGSMDERRNSGAEDPGRSRPALTPSQENYLGAIHELAAAGPVQVKDLAARVGVRLPSVTRAVGALARRGLVSHEAYGSIELTDLGREVGGQIARRAACLRRLLTDLLGMEPAEAGPEVNRLEHMLSEEVLSRLEILNDFALSSDAWIRRLRVRLQGRGRSGPGLYYRVGAARAHAGSGGRGAGERGGRD